MANSSYEDNRQKLADRIKSKSPALNIQEVRPIVEKKDKKESHVNFWMPEDLMAEVKMYNVKNKLTLKQFAFEAFSDYLKQKNT